MTIDACVRTRCLAARDLYSTPQGKLQCRRGAWRAEDSRFTKKRLASSRRPPHPAEGAEGYPTASEDAAYLHAVLAEKKAAILALRGQVSALKGGSDAADELRECLSSRDQQLRNLREENRQLEATLQLKEREGARLRAEQTAWQQRIEQCEDRERGMARDADLSRLLTESEQRVTELSGRLRRAEAAAQEQRARLVALEEQRQHQRSVSLAQAPLLAELERLRRGPAAREGHSACAARLETERERNRQLEAEIQSLRSRAAESGRHWLSELDDARRTLSATQKELRRLHQRQLDAEAAAEAETEGKHELVRDVDEVSAAVRQSVGELRRQLSLERRRSRLLEDRWRAGPAGAGSPRRGEPPLNDGDDDDDEVVRLRAGQFVVVRAREPVFDPIARCERAAGDQWVIHGPLSFDPPSSLRIVSTSSSSVEAAS